MLSLENEPLACFQPEYYFSYIQPAKAGMNTYNDMIQTVKLKYWSQYSFHRYKNIAYFLYITRLYRW